MVYVSWNGATEVESWEVYGGKTINTLTCLRTVSKEGFETAIKLEQSVKYVQVKAKLRASLHGRERCTYNNPADVMLVSA